ncbi:MAG: hypothetical protein ACUVTX_05995, partial [Bacteroidales bacterium]
MKRFAPVIFLICFSVTSAGQKTENSDTEGGKLFFGLKTFNFIKNNEYFNPIIEGYTLIGSFIRPEIIYAPSPMFEIELGVHQQIYSGEPENIKPRLLLSARWKVAGNSILTLGSFDGGNKHRMYDPHFNAERIYTYYTENGASFVTKGENIFTDTWINWENFIFRGDTVREIFTAGESFNYSLPLIKDFIKINLPVQAKFKHYGGQISNYSEHVLTFLNLSGGAGIDFSFAHEKYGTPGIEFLHFIYRELTRKNDIGITEGDASWIRVHYRYRWLYIGSYFWFSHNFYAPDGNQIYGSVSDYQPGYIIPDRKIWTSSVYLTLKPYNLFEILLGFEGYYDFRLKRMDTAV